MLHQDRSPDRGQAIVLFTLALTTIVLAVGVVIDGGFAFAQRRQAQNAADFAAMAGTRIVGISLTGQPPGTGTAANVLGAINSTLAANGAVLVNAQYVDEAGVLKGDVMTATSIPQGSFGVVVEARTDWKPFLLGVIGIDDWVASAPATAITPGESNGGGVLPIGILDTAYNALASCDVSEFEDCIGGVTPASQIEPGDFGWLSFGLQGAGGKCDWPESLGMLDDSGCQVNQPYLDSQIGPPADTHGCCGEVEQGSSVDLIGALTGNEWGDLSYYIDGQYMAWVPIYDITGGTGSNAWYHIVGFGAIVFDEQGDGSPHARWLKGKAVEDSCTVVVEGALVDYSHDDEDITYCLAPAGAHIVGATGAVKLVR